MPGKLSTLYELCLQRTARLLKTSYWNPELPLDRNPFVFLPSTVIDTLITYVTRISISERLLSSDLRLLLTSGRVREFIIAKSKNVTGDINVTDSNLQKMLMDLLPCCRNLITVKIRPVGDAIGYLPMTTPALNSLLSEAQSIKHVESCIGFDLRVLCHSSHLEKLILDFPSENCITDFLEVEGEFKRHASLKHLEVFEDEKFHYLDVANILKYCTELIYINHDISDALEYLHAEELDDGSLDQEYKIRKCLLGYWARFGSNFDVASSYDGVRITALICPQLRELRISVNKDLISALRYFTNITVLDIQWQPYVNGLYNTTLQSVLEIPEIGHNLKKLKFKDFLDVDFPSVGTCCPNLEVLTAVYDGDFTRSTYSPTAFQKLEILDLWSTWDDCKKDTLVGILSNATNLKDLTFCSATELTDEALEAVLKKNSLLKLKSIYFTNPGLSLCGWRNLARTLTALEYLEVFQDRSSSQEYADVIREINPRITVKWEVHK